jgi:uncharacterized membrane protein YgcG
MKKFLIAVMFGLMAIAAQAEATFEQIEGLIQQKNYAAAASGLEVIVQNHPKSAKAFYAMAQAQAGLGNLEKANKALTIATGLNPTLDFAPEGSVQKLKQAITPQVAKIEAVEESHALRNFVLFAMFAGFAVACYFMYSVYARKQEEEQAERDAEFLREEKARQEREAQRKREHMEMLAKQDAERKAELAAEAALKAHKNYGHERFDPANPDKLKSVKQFKAEQAEAEAKWAAEVREANLRAEAAEASARMYRTSAQAVQPTVVHTNSGSNDMLTGILVGNMLSGSHHDTTRVVEREVIREVPAKSSSRDSSWDDTPSTSSSRSSSWDDSSSSSSSRSSSWSDSSSSSSSSSWDSGSSSSSSDSGSSSSWD